MSRRDLGHKFTRLQGARLDDPRQERTRRTNDQAITELQRRRIVSAEVIQDIELPDGADVLVQHGLGRPVVCLVSMVRDKSGSPATSGHVAEKRGTLNPDPTKFVILNAAGWGGTVFVDVVVL